jgi:Holliday junction DNA helicase RuvA
MIGQLTGNILIKHPNEVVLDVGGVGYQVIIPLSTFYQLKGINGPITLKICTIMRQDSICLFGFMTDLEKMLFEKLISVSGVGPRMAIAVLSGIPGEKLINAVKESDLLAICSIPGIGKKTAERIILELRDKVLDFKGVEQKETAAGTILEPDLREDLISALINLGYQKNKAQWAVERASQQLASDAGFEDILRKALNFLTGSRF